MFFKHNLSGYTEDELKTMVNRIDLFFNSFTPTKSVIDSNAMYTEFSEETLADAISMIKRSTDIKTRISLINSNTLVRDVVLYGLKTDTGFVICNICFDHRKKELQVVADPRLYDAINKSDQFFGLTKAQFFEKLGTYTGVAMLSGTVIYGDGNLTVTVPPIPDDVTPLQMESVHRKLRGCISDGLINHLNLISTLGCDETEKGFRSYAEGIPFDTKEPLGTLWNICDLDHDIFSFLLNVFQKRANLNREVQQANQSFLEDTLETTLKNIDMLSKSKLGNISGEILTHFVHQCDQKAFALLGTGSLSEKEDYWLRRALNQKKK